MEDLSNENIVHIKNDEVEYIQFKKLLEYPKIRHCYTIRKNLNFKIYEDDSKLKESYNKISKYLKWNKQNIVKPHQTHTDNIEDVENCLEEFDNVDGVITNKKNIILCTTSADCTSILLFDPIKTVIADVQSGWKGTLKKIGKKATLKMINDYGSNPEDIIACICPYIKKCHFEVEYDVKKAFEEEFSYMKDFDEIISVGSVKQNIQKYNIDTGIININLLKEAGLREENIINSNICTVCNKSKFHSYRVDKELSG